MPAGDHDLAVTYTEAVAAADTIDLGAWECWAHRDGAVTRYYARGPCPGCRAATQGHIAAAQHPVEALGPDVVAPTPSDAVEIPVRCVCGHCHGSPGATGCGRRWSIICPPQLS